MNLRLGNLSVRLLSNNALLQAQWAEMRGSWQSNSAPLASRATVSFQLEVVRELPPPAGSPLLYRDSRGIVDVYGDAKNNVWLYFRAGALVRLKLDSKNSDPLTIEGAISLSAMGAGHLEDITFTTLAPLLRRHEHYLVHGAAVHWNGAAVLFVGPSGSGKTTTSLALLLAGCKYLASDLLLLAREHDATYIYPVPGLLKVRPHTLQLLPALQGLVARRGNLEPSTGTVNAQRLELEADNWASRSLVSTIIFPKVTQRDCSSLQRLRESVAMARLMEESIDRWDIATLEAHVDFLGALAGQCEHYVLKLGSDVMNLAQLLLAENAAKPVYENS